MTPAPNRAAASAADPTRRCGSIAGMRSWLRFFRPVCVLLLAGAAGVGHANDSPAVPAPAFLQARPGLPAEPAVADLKFREFYAMPIGPRGLAPSARLLSLAGQRVRIAGYMARQDEPTAGLMIVAPLPVVLGDEDERFADDLPPATLYVHLARAEQALAVPHLPGLLSFTGVLRLGSQREDDGRLSFVRLELDAALSSALSLALSRPTAAPP